MVTSAQFRALDGVYVKKCWPVVTLRGRHAKNLHDAIIGAREKWDGSEETMFISMGERRSFPVFAGDGWDPPAGGCPFLGRAVD